MCRIIFSLAVFFFALSNCVSSQAQSAQGDSELFSEFLKGAGTLGFDKNSRSVRSKSLDPWVQHYLKGDDKLAQRDWSQLIKDCRQEGSLNALVKQAMIRVEFSNSNDDTPRRSTFVAAEKMAQYTENAVAKNDLFLRDVYRYASNISLHNKNDIAALNYRKKVVQVEECAFGVNSPALCNALLEVAEAQIRCHQFADAQHIVERVVALNKAAPSPKITDWCRRTNQSIKESLAKNLTAH